MKLERLFNALVVMGASSTVGLTGCGGDDEGNDEGMGAMPSTATGGTSSGGTSSGGTSSGGTSSGGTSTGGTATGGTASGGTASGGTASGGSSGDACETACGPNTTNGTWTDCNGCCCWLPVGSTSPIGTPICGEEPCCEGRGR